MASAISDPNGRKRIQFIAKDGACKTIRLGKASMKQAQAVKVKVEQLVTASFVGSMDDEAARWVAELGDTMQAKLAAVGLVAQRQCMQLAAFLDGYIASRCDVKPATATVLGHTRRNLVDFFGADKPMREISSGDADAWRLDLIGAGLSENTVRRRCGIAKQYFKAAVRSKLISSNPFGDLASAVKANVARMFFVTTDMARKVLDACPNAQWKLIFALCRYGGLRCPSEVLALRWGDIDWAGSKMLVRSCKTEHHEGKETRFVPLFPELLPYLREVFELAAPGSEHVITRYRDASQNLRTQFERIIQRAGLTAWPKLFQNLRSTRETELAERWPEHVVCAWIGNSTAIARKHYLQVTEEHFERAAMAGAEATQNPTQQPTAANCRLIVRWRGRGWNYRGIALIRTTSQIVAAMLIQGGLGNTGLEPVTSWV